MANLMDTLFAIEKFLGLELDSLLPFAEQDDIGGFHPEPDQRQWGIGSIFGVEGQTLYALVRSLKPLKILEIGGGTGCSATHMAAAMKLNGSGHIMTLDRGNTPQIPDDLKSYVTVSNDDAINYLAMLPDGSLGMIFEDADHSEELCAAIGELAKSKLVPGGLLIAHDAAHFGVGGNVVRGYEKAGIDFRVYLTEPSDCGLLLARPNPLPKGFRIAENTKPLPGESSIYITDDKAYTELATAEVTPDGNTELSVNLDAVAEQVDASPVDTSVLQAQEDYADEADLQKKNADYAAQFNYPIDNGLASYADDLKPKKPRKSKKAAK